MACLITSGRKIPCKSAVGGIKNIFFADFGTLGAATIVSGEITAFAGTPDWFQFDIKNTATTMETAITSSRDNGTTFYDTTLSMTLTFQDVATQEQLKLIAVARPHVCVEDYNGNYFVVGLLNGAELNGGSIQTGGTMDSLTGYSGLTFNAQEVNPPFFVTPAVITADVSATQIVPN
tara:strand:+ start:2212 stop:2742 length:531 start_codon:yes stop_codon:yes gene_type:complete